MLNITSLNNLSAYINGFMESWIISLFDSVVNRFSTIRTGTMHFRLLRRTKFSEKRLVLAWRITYVEMNVCVCIYCYFINYFVLFMVGLFSMDYILEYLLLALFFNIIVSYDCMYVKRLRATVIGAI